MSNTCRLMHFLGKPPTSFHILDDPEAEETLLDAMVLQLAPREVDQGLASYWKSNTTEERDAIKAAYVARRTSRQTLDVLYISQNFLKEIGILELFQNYYQLRRRWPGQAVP